MDVVSRILGRNLTGVGDEIRVGGVEVIEVIEVIIGGEVEWVGVERVDVEMGTEVGMEGRDVEGTGTGCTVELHGI